MTQLDLVRIALVGAGRITDLHAMAYAREPRAELVAVCDLDEQTAEARAAEWGVERVFTDYGDLLGDPEIDAVEICTPTRTHAAMCIAAAEAGKHVSVQKPMALNMADAQRMVAAADASGTVLKVCENFVFYPPLVRARSLIDAGAIGTVLNVGVRMVSAARGGWEVPASAWRWRMEEAELAGGPTTFDHGHHMYAAAWFLGGPIDKVHAWINFVEPAVDAPATVHWNYVRAPAQGSVQFVMCNEMSLPAPYYSNDEWFEIVGSKGLIWVTRCTARLREDLAPVVVYRDGALEHLTDMPSDWAEGFAGALRNFVDAIRGDATPLLSGADGLEILAVDLAVQKSHRSERAVYVEEMLASVPSWTWARRHREDVQRHRPSRPSLWQRLLGDDGRYAPQCCALTEQLLERFNSEAVGDWSAVIAVHAEGEHGGRWTFRFERGELTVDEALAPEAELTVTLPAGTWAAILLGKTRVERAFLQGKLKVDGRAEVALPLRRAFDL